MVGLSDLWLPILVSAVLVFLVSAIIHMVLKYHNKDYTRIPNEDAVRAAIRAGNPAPAQYVIPYCTDMKDMEKPEMKQKYAEGPVAVINLLPPGTPNMGKNLAQWFAFLLVVSLFSGYVASHSPRARRHLPAGVPHRGCGRLHDLWTGTVPRLDLDGEAVGDRVQGHVGRTGLRPGDGGNVRVAVAEVGG